MIAFVERQQARVTAWIVSRSLRERSLIALFAMIAAFAFLTNAVQSLSQSRDEALELAATREMSDHHRAVMQTPTYIAAADRAARDVRTASIGGETIFIARARAQSEVENIAAAAGLTDVSVVLQPRERRVSKDDLVEVVLVDVSAAYDEAGLGDFLKGLAGVEYSLVPVSLSVRRGDAPRVDVRISAYALRAESGA